MFNTCLPGEANPPYTCYTFACRNCWPVSTNPPCTWRTSTRTLAFARASFGGPRCPGPLCLCGGVGNSRPSPGGIGSSWGCEPPRCASLWPLTWGHPRTSRQPRGEETACPPWSPGPAVALAGPPQAGGTLGRVHRLHLRRLRQQLLLLPRVRGCTSP